MLTPWVGKCARGVFIMDEIERRKTNDKTFSGNKTLAKAGSTPQIIIIERRVSTMMPMHLFILTIVKNVFKSEMTYEKLEQKQQVEQFYNDSRDKAFYYMHMM